MTALPQETEKKLGMVIALGTQYRVVPGLIRDLLHVLKEVPGRRPGQHVSALQGFAP